MQGMLFATSGSVYRKAGAIMLFGGTGQQLGLLSGGCLEADIAINARKVLASGSPQKIIYDGSDEDDISYRLGLGCGGSIHLLLQEARGSNNFLGMVDLREALMASRRVLYCQRIPNGEYGTKSLVIDPLQTVPPEFEPITSLTTSQTTTISESEWHITVANPPPTLLVVGAGVDAQPLVEIAAVLGWQVSVCDPRPANARLEHFPRAREILRCSPEELLSKGVCDGLDAAVIMSHNLSIDAEALLCLSKVKISYLGLLGPTSRRQRVIEMTGLKEMDLNVTLSGPAGLSLGGDLPESVALSILAECHATLYSASGASISEVLS